MTNGKGTRRRQEDRRKMRERWPLECPDPPEEDYEDGICPACNGSGEGMADGSKCWTCRGKGVL